MTSGIRVATGLAHGPAPGPEHATAAVQRALARAGLPSARTILLFLTPHYADNPEPALRAAARAGQCLQVIGATGAGLLTDEEWLLDAPGAAAMVLDTPLHTGAIPADIRGPILSFATPEALAASWLDHPVPRVGAISGDFSGHGPFRVWSGARVAEPSRVEGWFTDAQAAVRVSQGLRALTSPIEVADVDGLEIRRLGRTPALHVLVQSLPVAVREMDRLPLHLLMGAVTYGDPATAIRDGRYRLNHIVAANLADQSITLAQPLSRGERIFWAMRDALTASRDMRIALEAATADLAGPPEFALLFPCMSRGPHFFGSRDRDLDLMRERFPALPILGLYGNGEIGPLGPANHLYQYSAVVGLFRRLPHAE